MWGRSTAISRELKQYDGMLRALDHFALIARRASSRLLPNSVAIVGWRAQTP
jgi:hypothetical protein